MFENYIKLIGFPGFVHIFFCPRYCYIQNYITVFIQIFMFCVNVTCAFNVAYYKQYICTFSRVVRFQLMFISLNLYRVQDIGFQNDENNKLKLLLIPLSLHICTSILCGELKKKLKEPPGSLSSHPTIKTIWKNGTQKKSYITSN